MTEKEKLAKSIMRECENDGEPVTLEEALEMAEMELKAKKDCRRYETDKTKRKPTQKEVKLDADKVEIINYLFNAVKAFNKVDNVAVKNPQKEITFNVGEDEFSISLIKHRKAKA